MKRKLFKMILFNFNTSATKMTFHITTSIMLQFMILCTDSASKITFWALFDGLWRGWGQGNGLGGLQWCSKICFPPTYISIIKSLCLSFLPYLVCLGPDFSFGYETGKQGTPHLQGHVCFKNKVRLNMARGLLRGCVLVMGTLWTGQFIKLKMI